MQYWMQLPWDQMVFVLLCEESLRCLKKMQLEQVVGRIEGDFGVRITGRFSSWNLFSIFRKSETQTNNDLREYFSVNYYALILTCFRESSISCI